MKGALGFAAVLGGIAMLTGCETGPPLSAAQCQVADWRALGYQDGANGRPAERFVALQQACAVAGLPADQGLYLAGREEGLLTYCQPARAFQLGLSGSGYSGACPADLDPLFRIAHGDGYRAYEARQALESLESRLSSLRSERDDIERKLEANEAGLVASKTDDERARHKAEIDRLRNERRDVDERVRDAERDRRDRVYDLDRVRASIGFQYGPW